MSKQSVRRGGSLAQEEKLAAKELYDSVLQDQLSLVVFFSSPKYDKHKLGAAIKDQFGDISVIGCTTAGEIGEHGYSDHSITGFSLNEAEFDVEVTSITNLKDFSMKDGNERVTQLQHSLGSENQLTGENCFGFLLVDGLSVKEELLISGIYSGIGDLNIFGGSAGDDLSFTETSVYIGGEFIQDAAILALVHTSRPFKVFKTQHYVASDKKLVVTEAIPEKRIVTEINGEPAGEEYARLIGCELKDLEPKVFAELPLVLKSGGSIYVRSIQELNADGSLTFYCAIDEGIVLTVAEGKDIKLNLLNTFEDVKNTLGEPQLVIGCDCIMRRLEVINKNLTTEMGEIMKAHNVIGFSTYGEQFQAMHVNQTLTGVAIG